MTISKNKPRLINYISDQNYFFKSLAVLCSFVLLAGLPGCQVKKAEPAANNRLTNSEVKLRMIRRENFAQPIKSDSAALEEIYKKTGVRIEIESVPQINYENKIKSLMASDNLPDIILANQKDLMNYAPTGTFLPLLEKIDTLAPNFKKFMKANPDIDKVFIHNELYAFPVSNWKHLVSGNASMIRMDLLKSLNIKMPETYDELLDTLEKLKKAFPQEDVWINKYKTANLLNATSYALGSGYDFTLGYYFDHDADGGKFLYGPSHPEFKPVLEFLNKAYSRGLLDPNYNLSTVQQWNYKLSSGKALFYFDSAELGASFDSDYKKSHPEAEFAPLINLKNSKGQSRLELYRNNHWVTNNYAINSKSKNADIAIRLIDWMYSEEGAIVTNYGVLNEHYSLENGQIKIKQDLLDKYKDNPDPFHTMQSDLGTGRFSICPYIDETLMMISQPGLSSIISTLKNQRNARSKVQPPPMEKEEQERISSILSELEAYFDKEVDKFIMGIRPISEYNEVIQRLKFLGSDEMEKILNNAYARYKSSHPLSK
ncbi:MAG: transporter substrate-binding protein [Clostridiales bacterium]|jgi:ABC-type glycerol-3-phosphate transport system substrate-binding protein|nr:transporter substrate-binding protein [Clostridiales bacterium]